LAEAYQKFTLRAHVIVKYIFMQMHIF